MSAEVFLALADLLPEPMLLVAKDLEIEAANRAVGELVGGSPADLVGQSLTELVAEERVDQLERYLRDCFRSRQMLPGSILLRTPAGEKSLRVDGGLFLVPDAEARAVLRLRSRESSVSRFTVLNQRIDDLSHEVARRQRAEEDLEAQRRGLEITLASIADAVIATDASGRLLLMNPVAEDLTGWDLQDAGGKDLGDVFKLIDESEEHQGLPVARIIESGDIFDIENRSLLTREGRQVPVEASAAPIRVSSGRVLGLVLIFRDVSGRRQAEVERTRLFERERQARRKAEEADRTKDEFLALLSHELRAPLQAIANWVYILRNETVGETTRNRALDIIERNLERQTRLVDELLDTSQIAANQVALEIRPLSLSALIEAVREELQEDLAQKEIDLELHLDPAADEISGDPLRLRQVIWQLLSNALKFTPQLGRIEIDLTATAGKVELRISDSGQGIEDETLPIIFDRFRQADASRTRSHGGLGLGLSIARHWVEMHGGTLSARSLGPGRGATFTVTLPRDSAGRSTTRGDTASASGDSAV